MTSVLKLLKRLASKLFYGTLTIKFQAGKVVIFTVEESFKPEGD